MSVSLVKWLIEAMVVNIRDVETAIYRYISLTRAATG